jgi:methionine-rich copper-binding protein CopC
LDSLALKTLAVLSLVALLGTLPEGSWGHAFPDHSEPKVGSTVSGSLASVRIWFDGALEPTFSTIIVHDHSGKRVDKGDSKVNSSDAKLLEVSLSPLTAGTYHVMWNVVSRDGHRTSGDFSFVIK